MHKTQCSGDIYAVMQIIVEFSKNLRYEDYEDWLFFVSLDKYIYYYTLVRS